MLFQGSSGAVFDIDVECLRPNQREQHEAQVAAGELTPVPPRSKRATKPAE
jgi:hypothetical protein